MGPRHCNLRSENCGEFLRSLHPKTTRSLLLVGAILVGALTGIAIIKALGTQKPTSAAYLSTATESGFVAVSGLTEPSWSTQNLNPTQGRLISSSDYSGKSVVLNFWASWCVPCRKELPAMETVSQRAGAKVQFIGINTADQRQLALSFLTKTGVRYLNGFDPNSSVGSKFGVIGLPVTVFISPHGDIVGRQVGAISAVQLENLLHRLFSVDFGGA